MKTLSQKQKIGTLSLVIFGFALVGLISTGKLDMSRLSSSVLNGSTYICTENGQKRNLNEYKQAVRNKEQAEDKIKIMSGEIAVIKNTIESHQKTIASHGEAIIKQNVTIGQLFDYISKNCTRPKTPRENALCIQKKQQKSTLEQSNKNLTNQITNLKNLITRLEGQLKQKNENISTWNKKIEQFSKYIKDYDLCNESLNSRLIITSPLMSGEVTMSGEVGKRVELYKFSMTIPAPAKAQINEIRFDTAFGPGNIELDDWYVTENSTTTSIYPCTLQNNGQFSCILKNKASGNFGLENGRVQDYLLSAMVKDIKEPGSLKIYGISKEGVIYNETRRDADNQSTPIKINYSNKAISQIGGYTVSCNSIGNNAASGCNTCKRADIDTQTPFSPVALFTSRNNSTNEIISLTGSSIYTKTYQDVAASPTGYIIDRFDLALSASAPSWTWAKMKQGQSISINGVPSNVNLNDPIYGVIFATTSSLKDVPASDISNKTCLFIYAKNDIKCGNGIKEGNEQCDDGNTENGDGCDNLCKNEATQKLSGLDVTFPSEVTVDKPFDMKVRAVDAAGATVPQYEGKVLFKIMDRPETDYIMPKIPGSNEFGYQFNLADQGSRQFTEGFTFKKAGIYSVVVLDSATQNNPVSVYRSFWITAKESAVSCTGILPTNATILANVGNTSRPWTYDGSPTGPYQSCSFQCSVGHTYKNGECQQSETQGMCLNLAVNVQTIRNGGTVAYSCSGAYNTVAYSVVLKKPDGTIMQTLSSAAGIFTIPAIPSGPYTIECFTNGQTTTTDICKKTITNEFLHPWTVGEWGYCSNKTKYRSVECRDGNKNLIDEKNCSDPKPENSMACEEPANITITQAYEKSTPGQYIAVGSNGIVDGSKQVFNIKATGGSAKINQITFSVDSNPTGQSTVQSIRINNTSVPVIGRVATFQDLNLDVPNDSVGIFVEAYPSYTGVGVGGLSSPTLTLISLDDVSYSSNGETRKMSFGVFGQQNRLVRSKLVLSAAKPNSRLTPGADVNIIDILIAADSKGDITLNSFPLDFVSNNVTMGSGTNVLSLRDDSNVLIPTSHSTISTGAYGTSYVTINGGLVIPAGTVKKLRVYAKISTVGLGELTPSLSTNLSTAYGFSWTDTAGGGQAIMNDTGWIKPYPSDFISVIRN